MAVPVRIYLETDPVLPQIEVALDRRFTIDLLSSHTHHFSYAENLGGPDCGVPCEHFAYCPTRQPIVTDWWPPGDGPRLPAGGATLAIRRFSTVTNWEQLDKDVEWEGERYGWSKHHEFLKLITLPRQVRAELELALASRDAETIGLLRSHGWRTLDALAVSKDISTYRRYILHSDGEFTVAKDQNVRLRSGWFSDRSACYLAAGKPVITQDTGFGKVIPTGEGLFAFSTMDDVIAAFEALEADFPRHSRAATEIADEYFKAETVLSRIIDRLNTDSCRPSDTSSSTPTTSV